MIVEQKTLLQLTRNVTGIAINYQHDIFFQMPWCFLHLKSIKINNYWNFILQIIYIGTTWAILIRNIAKSGNIFFFYFRRGEEGESCSIREVNMVYFQFWFFSLKMWNSLYIFLRNCGAMERALQLSFFFYINKILS